MNKEGIYILEDRGIIYINGDESFNYLQNIISNDLNKVSDNKSCFSYLLTPQGKYLFEFIIIKHKNGYFLDCPKYQIENLYKQLTLYKLRSKVEISNLSNEFVVAALSKDKFSEFNNSDPNTVLYNKNYSFSFKEQLIPGIGKVYILKKIKDG